MRRSWLALPGTLLLTTPLFAAPSASPVVTPEATRATASDFPEIQQTTTNKAVKVDARYAKVPQLSSIDPRISVGDVGILMGIDSTELVQAGGLHMVNQYDETHPNAAGTVSLIRNGNHKITGTEVKRYRAVGDVDGSVYVHYTVKNGQGGRNPHVRKIKPDNSLGFDLTVLMEEKAGIAPDGAGGVYLVTHKTFDADGNFYTDSTAHNSMRIDAAGTILWQVAEPGVPKPHADSDYWSSAARSTQGVYAGYGIGAQGTNDQTPVILHRKAGDGSVIYKRTGLKGPASGSGGGAVGTTPLKGRVDKIWPQSDGSVVARVFNQTVDQNFVRVDASGTQTAAFKCSGYDPRLQPHNNGVICALLPSDGTITVHHYGISSGNLKLIGNFTTAAILSGGWNFDNIAVTVDGQYLATASTNSGFAGLALFSAQGALLFKDLATARPGVVTQLIVGGHDWLAMHKGGDIDPRMSVFRGTFAPGNN